MLSNFIDPYVKTVRLWTDAPDDYHLGCGLSVVGSVLSGKVWIVPQECTTNLWVLLVGRSESDRKSTSIRFATDVLSLVAPERVLPDPGSHEGLVAALSGPANIDGTSNGQQLLVVDEFQFLLDKFRPGAYSAPIMSLLNSLYDWKDIFRRKLVNREFVITNAAVSMLGACTPQHIEKRQNEEFWQGGFFSRLFIVSGERTRQLPYSRRPFSEFKEMVARLDIINKLGPRELDFDPDSHQVFERWALHNMHRQETTNPLVRGMVGRLNLAILKIAAIREVDVNLDRAQRISEESLLWAVDFVERMCEEMIKLPTEIAFTEDMRKRRRVVELIEADGRSILYSKLLRHSHMTARDLRPILETLEQEGTVSWDGKGVTLNAVDT